MHPPGTRGPVIFSKIMSKPIQAALYVRVSTSDRQDAEMQIRELTEYALARSFPIYRVYEDKGYSGSNGNRPMLKALMQDIHEGKVTHVLCWRLDRWFRSLKEVVTTLNDLTERNVTFISLKDGIDLSSSTGRLLANLLACFAQFELEVIRERVRSGLENARRKGRVGGRRPTIDAEQARRLHEGGQSLRQIAKTLGVTKSGVSKTLKKLRQKTK